MVAGGMGGHPRRRLGIGEGKDSVERTTKLEGPHFLKILALEMDAGRTGGIDGATAQHWRAVGVRSDARRGGLYIGKTDFGHDHSCFR